MKLYIIDIKLIILTQLSLKWLFFCSGIPKKFQEHDILTFSLLHVNNQDLNTAYMYSCFNKAMLWALGIEQYIVWWSLREIIVLFGMPKCPIANLYLISYINYIKCNK